MTIAVPQLAFVDRAIDLESGGGFELTLTRGGVRRRPVAGDRCL